MARVPPTPRKCVKVFDSNELSLDFGLGTLDFPGKVFHSGKLSLQVPGLYFALQGPKKMNAKDIDEGHRLSAKVSCGNSFRGLKHVLSEEESGSGLIVEAQR